MAWTTPRTWIATELVTAAQMNTHVRDNLAYLKGSAGTITFDSGITVPTITNAEWFRTTGASMGIYNQTHNQGVGINASGPYNYINGSPLVNEAAAQTLSSKTLSSPTLSGTMTGGTLSGQVHINPLLSGTSGFAINTTNDLTNYWFWFGTGTATLPAASGRQGQLRFIKAWGGAVTVNSGTTNLASPGNTGTMQSTFSLANGDSLTMVCDGTYWWVI